MNKTQAMRVLGEVQQVLGLEEKDVERIPQIVRLLAQMGTELSIVAFAFHPATRQVRQVAVSQVPPIPEAYQVLSQVTGFVAQQFQNLAVEVAKKNVGQQSGVEGTEGARENAERGDGRGPEGPRVGKVPIGPAPASNSGG